MRLLLSLLTPIFLIVSAGFAIGPEGRKQPTLSTPAALAQQTPTQPTTQQPSATPVASCLFEPFPTSLTGRVLLGHSASSSETASLLVVDLEQHRITPISVMLAGSGFASFSPDGSQLAFTGRDELGKSVIISDWDGTNQFIFPNSKGSEFADWVASESQSQLLTFTNDGKLNVAKVEHSIPSSKTLFASTQLALPSKLLEARLSPDGGTLLYATTKFWPGTDTCTRSLSANTDSCPLAGSLNFSHARWSKSGDSIAYEVGDGESSSIGILNRKTKVKTLLPEAEGFSSDPVWNPGSSGTSENFIYANMIDGKARLLSQEIGKPAIPIATCTGFLRVLDWSATKTMEVEALRVKRTGNGT